MPLGTLDRTPPPFFRQGPSALTKLVFFSALAVFLMVADARFSMVSRCAPRWPPRCCRCSARWRCRCSCLDGGRLPAGHRRAPGREPPGRGAAGRAGRARRRTDQLAGRERAPARLLDLRPRCRCRSVAAEVMYEAADPFRARSSSTAAQRQGVVAGAPVINEPACWAR
jgi:rod shape-determining protein MreC